MKRHDTHLLSDESEKEKKEEDAHQYNFNNSSNSSDDSEEKYISKESNQNGPAHVNFLKLNNLTNDVNYYNNDKNEVSIISSKELEDIFYVDSKNNKNKNFSTKKKKKKKNKYFIKLRKIKLNDDELIDNCLTYNPSLRNEVIDKKIYYDNIKNKNRNCISLNNSNNKNNDRAKLKKNKRLDTFKEKEVLYFFYNDDNEGNKKLKRVINIINKEKSQLFKISNKNCFTIKNTYFTSISSKRGKYTNPFNDNYRHKLIEKYNAKNDRINYSAKISFNGKKNNNNYLSKENNKCENLNISLQNYNKIKDYRRNLRDYYNKNCSKEKILYDLYCNKLDSSINSLKKQRIKSTDSLMRKRQNYKFTKNTSNCLERDDYFPEEIRYMELHEREKENRKIIRGMFRKAGQNFNDFNRHVGNDANCPVCQAMQMKNENNIKIKGINPLFSSIHNNSNNCAKNSWQNRRIYSALSRVLTKKQIDRSASRSTNISNMMHMNKARTKNQNCNNLNDISRIKSKKEENNKKDSFAFRKLNFNRGGVNQNRFPNSNKIINFKNNILYN